MDQKIVITNAADQQLEEMKKIVNDGFSSGKVGKMQLASWIISYFFTTAFTKQMKKIRADHFDQIAHLKAVVKQMEEAKRTDGTLELNRLLMPLKTSVAKAHKPAPENTNEK